MAKIQYRGSANSIPSLNIRFSDGEILEVDDSTAKKLVSENIGFSYTEAQHEPKEAEEKKKRR